MKCPIEISAKKKMVRLSTTLAKSVMALYAPNGTDVTVYGEEFSLSTNPNSMKKPGVL